MSENNTEERNGDLASAFTNDNKSEKSVMDAKIDVERDESEYTPFARFREIKISENKSIWCLELTPLKELREKCNFRVTW